MKLRMKGRGGQGGVWEGGRERERDREREREKEREERERERVEDRESERERERDPVPHFQAPISRGTRLTRTAMQGESPTAPSP